MKSFGVHGEWEEPTEARCDSRMHFKVYPASERIEIKCNHIGCHKGNSVVLHYFDFKGNAIETIRVQDPAQKFRKGNQQ